MLLREMKIFLLFSAYWIELFDVDYEFLLSEVKHTIK